MPVFTGGPRRRPRPNKELIQTYQSFRRGLNTFLLDNELDPEELVKLDNMRLVGKGIVEPRGGTGVYYRADEDVTVRALMDFYVSGTGQLLAVTDNGFLTRKSGASYQRIMGASFASGARPEMAQVEGIGFLVDGVHPMARFDGTTLIPYTQISRPTSLSVTKSSGTTGSFTHSWRVSAEGVVGETLASDAVTLATLPENLTTTNYVTLTWTGSSPASYVRGYVIYGREQGAESFLARVPSGITTWIDDGQKFPSNLLFPPDIDSTAGPVAKHARTYKGLLVLANTRDDKDLFMWGGVGPNVDKFTYSSGGGYYPLEKDSGDRFGITGISEREGKMILFKGSSIFQVNLTYNSDLGINEPTITKLVDGVGCVSAQTVHEVENSVMFVANIQGRGLALAKLDYEPNILSNVLRFQPISARVQSIIDRVNMERIEESWAVYYNKTYYWFLPVGGTSWACLPYDVERTAFVGPYTLTNAWCGVVHQDDTNQHRLLMGKANGTVIELSDQYASDEGNDFTWTMLTKKDDFKRPFQLKIVQDAKTKLRNVSGGPVNISYIIEDQNGIGRTAKTKQVTPPTTLAGWGSRGFARSGSRWAFNPSKSTTNSNVAVDYEQLNAANVLSVQTQISGTGSRAQVLAIEVAAREMSRKVVPSSWR